jgi:uncharacterized protein involved in exopolysaccharide biosynthesis
LERDQEYNPRVEGIGGEQLINLLKMSISFVLRHRLVFLLSVASSVVLAIFYLRLASPSYVVQAQLLIDPSAPTDINQHSSEQIAQPGIIQFAQPGIIESYITILNSPQIAIDVINKRHLLDNSGFIAPPSGRTLSFSLLSNPEPDDMLREAVRRFSANLTVRRVGPSNIIEISFRASNRELAAAIANGTAEIFVETEIEARQHLNEQASNWFRERLRELQTQAVSADKAVQDFSDKNGIGGQEQLRQLRSDAETAHTLYDVSLRRFIANQGRPFPISVARVISPAVPALANRRPDPRLILFLAAATGVLVAIGIGLVRVSLLGLINISEETRGRAGGAEYLPQSRLLCSTLARKARVRDRQ